MQTYLTNPDYEDRWRALSLEEMQQQPAFSAVLAYYKDKGDIVPTFGQYLEANGHVVVTFVFTDKADPTNTMFAEGADAICSAYPTLSELRRHGISKTSVTSYDPFDWKPPADPVTPTGPVKLPKPVFLVGNSYNGGPYQNLGDIPYVGAVYTDARGKFVAQAHQSPFGTTYDWTLVEPASGSPSPTAPAPVAPAPSQPAPSSPIPGLNTDALQAIIQAIVAQVVASLVKKI